MRFPSVSLGALMLASRVLPTFGAPADPKPYQYKQPDGTLTSPISLKGSINFHREEDMNGYTVINDEKGYKVYAKKNEENGLLESSGLRVGSGNPERYGLKKHIVETREERNEVISEEANTDMGSGFFSSIDNSSIHQRRLPVTEGTLKALVILIKFADHVDRQLPSQEEIHLLYNSDGKSKVTPFGSVKDVYKVSSHGKLNVESTVTPWITLSKPEEYYSGGDSAKYTSQIFEAVREALYIAAEKKYVKFSDFDRDNDGTLDLFNIIHSGYDATSPTKDCAGQNRENRIWSQTRSLSHDPFTSNDGITVAQYTLSSALTGYCGNAIAHIGTLAHEMGHYLGIPDLYDRDGGGKGIGAIGLMGTGHGFDLSGHHPSIMCAWTKAQLNWATPTIIDEPGQYSLEVSSKNPQIYKIKRGFPEGEFLLLENRQRMSFDSTIPHGGIAIWHIDKKTNVSYNLLNEREGYPGQAGWPRNGLHYYVSLVQADGKYDLEKGLNSGDGGDLFHAGGVSELRPSAHPIRGPFPNTDSYQNGNVKQTGIVIKNISEIGEIMTFEVDFVAPTASADIELVPAMDDSMKASISAGAFAQEIKVDDPEVYTSSSARIGGLIQDLNSALYDFDSDSQDIHNV